LKPGLRITRRALLGGLTAAPFRLIARASSSEYRRLKDDVTGATVHQLTSHPSINHPTYFLTSSFTPDRKYVIFTSYRSGAPQLYELEFPDGPMRQLTKVEGLHPYSATISRDGSEIYFTRKGSVDALRRKDLSVRTLLALEGAQFGECGLSHDGLWIVTAMKQGSQNGVALASTAGKKGGVLCSFPRTIIHPQFHPTDSNWVEFSGDPAPRMHRVRRDGSGLECLYQHDNDEFVVHETFLGRTGDIVFTVWPRALRRMDWNTRKISTIAEFNAWHITPNKAGSAILCDTNHPDIGLQLVDVATGRRRTLCHPRSSNGGSQWKKSSYALEADFAAARQERKEALSWMEMPTDTVYGPQWTHPHPSFSPDEKLAVYTSDVSGHAQVYAVEI
jgi:oligogalacturonide lyase